MRQRHHEPHGFTASEADIETTLSTIRLHEERWDEYRRAMNEHTSRFEEAAAGLGTGNYYVQRGLAARRELDSYVGQLAHQQTELLADAMHDIRSAAETAAEMSSREEAGASWD